MSELAKRLEKQVPTIRTADKVAPEVRSAIMRRVHGSNTAPEIEVRRRLHGAGYRFRIHNPNLLGTPDIVLPKYRTIVFVHGCFWHKHLCAKFRWPIANASYWVSKIDRNHRRDVRNARLLRREGWRVYVVWGCDVERGVGRVLQQLDRLRNHRDPAQGSPRALC